MNTRKGKHKDNTYAQVSASVVDAEFESLHTVCFITSGVCALRMKRWPDEPYLAT